jgi:AMP deaminase
VDEWDKLASWVVDNKLFSHNVRWLIQIPRLYNVYKSTCVVTTFNDLIKSTSISNIPDLDIFQPLFEVTQNPQSHPKLHIFLQRVVGFDSVDDESKAERRLYRKYPVPQFWDTEQNPPYSYYIYYFFANMTSLNAWRKMRNFNTFVLRPHCGEAGDTDHLASAFLTSQGLFRAHLKTDGNRHIAWISPAQDTVHTIFVLSGSDTDCNVAYFKQCVVSILR